MKYIFRTFLIILLLNLAACTAVNFQSKRGYMDSKKISENIHQIIAFNDSSQSVELIKNAAMYFAAQTTIEQGKKRFIILNEDLKTSKKIKIDIDDEQELEDIKQDGYIIIDDDDKNIKTDIKSILLIELIDESDARFDDALNADKLVRELKPIIYPDT